MLKKAVKKFWPIGLASLFLLFAGILAITQETEEEYVLDELPLDDMLAVFPGDEGEWEDVPVWVPPGRERWFRSNAGGMTLEEIPSRTAALRNKYALVIDYLPPDEIEQRLLSYYKNNYIVEIRILYVEGEESRRQWLFRDDMEVVRINAVFSAPPAEQPYETEIAVEEEITLTDDVRDIAEIAESGDLAVAISPENPPEEEPWESSSLTNREAPLSVGFIEIFNEKKQIIEERRFFNDDSETLVIYSYNTNVLVKAEAREKLLGDEFRTAYTDYYRYNRSYSLRHVERQFYGITPLQPVRLTFPGRVLDAALEDIFSKDKLAIFSDFLGGFSPGEGYNIIYHTDSRGRILSQTMFNSKNEVIWVITNTWSGDRIIAIQKKESDDIKITEYEYNANGERIVQRDIHNGVLERLIRTEGENETEELYLNGILAMRAYWVNGRKISEERVQGR